MNAVVTKSVFDVVPTDLPLIDLTYTDPPWGQANITAWSNKAGVKRQDWRSFLHALISVVKHTEGPVFIEMGLNWQKDLEREIQLQNGTLIKTVEITYYKRRPVNLTLCTWGYHDEALHETNVFTNLFSDKDDKEIPVVFVDMTPEQMRVATLSHNRARGSEDVQLTAELLRDLEKMGALEFAQKQLDLDDVEIQRLINDIPAPEALAAENFSKPWTPDGMATQDKQADVSLSVEATERVRVNQKKIDNAKTEQDREQARRDSGIKTFNLIYTGKEGELVKSVLGNQPAQKVLELCIKEQACGKHCNPTELPGTLISS